ncbi:hypothetical protein COBT_002604, partial [Conglomerata obtusa]
MDNFEDLEMQLIQMNSDELIYFLCANDLIEKTMVCLGSCQANITLEPWKKYVDDTAWRCYIRNCTSYQKRRSLRDGSFFEQFGEDILKILKIIIRYAGHQSRFSILETIQISKPTIRKRIQDLVMRMKQDNDNNTPLGIPGC